jgi:glycosyltransferase involved in cell wall biosynthesis
MVLSQYYTPEPIPKPAELAHGLVDRGHAVSVLTGWPNYPQGTLYPGFRIRPLRRETLDGIPVVRTYEFPYHGKGVLGRICNYVSFMMSAVLGSVLIAKCDVIYVWHPPLTVGVAAWLIARIRGIPFVYDVQDIWPESAILAGVLREGTLARLMASLERFVYRRADYILVVTGGARENLIAKGVPPEKISVARHWVDATGFQECGEEARRRVRSRYGWEGRFIVLFAGNIGMLQALDTVVHAAAGLADVNPTLFVLVGDGSDKARLQQLARASGAGARIHFIERQPAERMPELMAAADALLVHLRRSELSRYVIPTKTLAYLAAGKPLLMAMEGAAADLVDAARAGIRVPPEDPGALAKAAERLAAMSPAEREEMGRSGRAYLAANLSRTDVIPEYETILQRVAGRNGH